MLPAMPLYCFRFADLGHHLFLFWFVPQKSFSHSLWQTWAPVMGRRTPGASEWLWPGSRCRGRPGHISGLNQNEKPFYLGKISRLKQVWSEEHFRVRHAVTLGGVDERLNILHQHKRGALCWDLGWETVCGLPNISTFSLNFLILPGWSLFISLQRTTPSLRISPKSPLGRGSPITVSTHWKLITAWTLY